MTSYNWHNAAELEGFHSCTGWTTEDVKHQADELAMEITDDEALDLLILNSNRITEAMVSAGFNVITDLLLDIKVDQYYQEEWYE